MSVLLETVSLLRWQHVVMWAIGGILIYLAIRRKMEPALLLPMGFGAILVNLPLSGAVTQIYYGAADTYVGLAFTTVDLIVDYIKKNSVVRESDTEIGRR